MFNGYLSQDAEKGPYISQVSHLPVKVAIKYCKPAMQIHLTPGTTFASHCVRGLQAPSLEDAGPV
jgi:hypothetical protein